MAKTHTVSSKLAGTAALIGAALAMLSSAPAAAQSLGPRGELSDQQYARMGKLQGQLRPLPSIIQSVRSQSPYNGMDYMGFGGYDSVAQVYSLRFMDGRRLVVVDVDARTGHIIRQSR